MTVSEVYAALRTLGPDGGTAREIAEAAGRQSAKGMGLALGRLLAIGRIKIRHVGSNGRIYVAT